MRNQLRQRRKKPTRLLVVSIVSLITLLTMVLFVPPATTFSVLSLEVSVMSLFFLLLILFFYSLPAYLFSSKKHGILLSSFISLYLLFRLMDITHPFFLIILLALFLTLELLFTSRPNE